MKRGLLTVALAAFLFAPAANAGFLVGASVGKSNVDVTDSGFSFDESDTGFEARVGYRFLKFVGVEVGYVDFGSPDKRFGSGEAKIEADGFDIFAVGAFPFANRWEIFGKVGYINWDGKATLKLPGTTMKSDDDGTDFSWGAGVGFKIFGPLHVRAEYESFSTDNVDFTMTTVGADIRF